jgi:hypothetical protein
MTVQISSYNQSAMVFVTPPPELLCSPRVGKISNCSKVLVFEPSPAKPVERVSSSLFLLRFDNEDCPRLGHTLVLCMKTFTIPLELVNLGKYLLLRALLALSLFRFFLPRF